MVLPRAFIIGLALLTIPAGCATIQGKHEKVRLEDPLVTAKVKEALAKDPVLQKYDIEVRTVDGKVVLRGKVDSSQDVYRAAEVVNNVEGVQSLLNMLMEK